MDPVVDKSARIVGSLQKPAKKYPDAPGILAPPEFPTALNRKWRLWFHRLRSPRPAFGMTYDTDAPDRKMMDN